MNIKIEKTNNNNELKLFFTVEAAKFDEEMKKVYTKTAKYFNVPGFRRGKAPMRMIENQYGEEIFYEDTFNSMLPSVYQEAIETNKIEAVSKPDIEITQIGKGQDLIFTAIVQTKPEVKLGKYKGIEIAKKDYTVSDEETEKELTKMAERNSRLVTVENRPVQEKDIAVIDFEGFVDGVPFEGGKAENHELEIGSKSFIEGFEDQVIGMNIGEEKEINVKFPDEYFSKELEGKDAKFKVKVNEIKKKEVPQIDDEFAKDVSEFETVKELKASIKERLEKEKKSKLDLETENELIKAACENAEVEIPSGMIETETDNIIQEFSARLSYQGLKLEQYLEMVNLKEDDLREQYKDQAEINAKTKLVLEEIAKQEKIEPDIQEISDKIKEMATNYGKKEEELNQNNQLKEYIKNSIKSEKVIKLLVDNANIK